MPFDPNFCDFCGKGEREVKYLIAGPMVLICDECIDAAKQVGTQILIDRAVKTVARST